MSHKLLYATPTLGYPKIDYFLNVRSLEHTCKSFKIFEDAETDHFCYPTGLVHAARNNAAKMAIDNGYDFMLMQDDDTTVLYSHSKGNPIDALYELMKDETVGIAGCPVRMGGEYAGLNIKTTHPKFGDYQPIPEFCDILSGIPDKPFEIDAIGAAFTMYRVSMLEEMMPFAFRFTLHRNRFDMTAELSEDIGICLRAYEMGFKIMCEPRFTSQHFKEQAILTYKPHLWNDNWEPPPELPVIRKGDLICRDGCPDEFLEQYKARKENEEEAGSLADLRRLVSRATARMQSRDRLPGDQEGGSGG